MTYQRWIYSVWITLLLCYSAQAQHLLESSMGLHSSHTVQYWKTEDGLPQNTVLSIAQDRNGLLWILTYAGLSRFDGQNFTPIDLPSQEQIVGIIASPFKDAGTDEMLIYTDKTCYRYRNKRFYPFNIKNERVLTIVVNSQGTTYAITQQNKLYELDKNQGIKNELEIPGEFRYLSSTQNALIVGTVNGWYLYELSKLVPLKGTENLQVQHIAENDNTLFFSNAKGIFSYDITQNLLTDLQFPIDKQFISSLTIDKTKQYLWLTSNTGAYYKDLSKKEDFTKVTAINEACNTSFIDHEKNTWIGINNAGLYLLKPKLFHTYGSSEKFSIEGIAALIEPKSMKGTILCGNNNWGGGLFKVSNSQIEKCNYKNLKAASVCTLCETHDGTLVLGGVEGLKKYKDGITTPIKIPDEHSKSNFLSVFEDSKHRLWTGTSDGLFTISNTNELKPVKDFPFKHTAVIQLVEDNQQKIWVATSTGIALYKDGVWRTLALDSGQQNTYVRCLHFDNENNLWIGTRGKGLLKYTNGKVFNYSDFKGILNKDVWCILEDDRGYFWMTSNNGIYAVSRYDLINFADGKTVLINVRHFDRTDGMLNTEFNGGFQPACLKASNGKLWFPNMYGPTVVDPTMVDFTPATVPIKIEKIRVDGQEYIINSDSTITIAQKPRLIEFVYAAPSFSRKKEIFFQTGLDGYDSNWNSPTQATTSIYKNLSPGIYTFKARIYGNYKREINKEAYVKIIIPPPLWQTPLFIILFLILIVGLIILIAYLRIKYVRKQAEEKGLREKQYAALELKALQSQMNPHFIFNCMNAIKYFIAVHDEASASKYLNIFSRLLRKFLEHSNTSTISLSDEIELLQLYINLQQMRFDEQFEYDIELKDIAMPQQINIPTMLFQPYIENAIVHGLLPLKRKGKLSIQFTLEDNVLIGSVEDNGIGRKVSLKNKSTRIGNTSMGMALTQNRIDLLNYFNNYSISLSSKDTFTDGREETGTTIIISIPITQPL